MANMQERLDDIIAKLRQRECRITPQRIAILKAFLHHEAHPSIEQVHEQVKVHFPTTSLATVYKTVNLLKEIGEILEIGFADGSNRYDGNRPHPHPHLICTQCRTIIDSDSPLLDAMTAEAEQSSGYRIVAHHVQFFGICPSCQQIRAS